MGASQHRKVPGRGPARALAVNSSRRYVECPDVHAALPTVQSQKEKFFFHVASRLAFVQTRASFRVFPRLPVAGYDFLTGYANRGTSLRFAGTDAVARPGPPP